MSKGSERRDEILDYITSYTTEHGFPPTVRDITVSLNYSSTSAVHHHLMKMEEDGTLRSVPGRSRTWTITREPDAR